MYKGGGRGNHVLESTRYCLHQKKRHSMYFKLGYSRVVEGGMMCPFRLKLALCKIRSTADQACLEGGKNSKFKWDMVAEVRCWTYTGCKSAKRIRWSVRPSVGQYRRPERRGIRLAGIIPTDAAKTATINFPEWRGEGWKRAVAEPS
ncbi:hypothetical protein NQ318_006679 [Aromia moschata]|uniref:Uncharacterized protein n=1 Tax=Aromia moschata TaxID=1265417 RepID=A0AAV8YPI3_9CUCU|nr:hypothetical protein NQ318_006679 [Aromia moschata]